MPISKNPKRFASFISPTTIRNVLKNKGDILKLLGTSGIFLT